MHQLGHQRLGVGQRLQTAADIPRRGHTQVLPQAAGAAAAMCSGSNVRDVDIARLRDWLRSELEVYLP